MNYIKILGMFVLAFLMIIVAQALGAIFDEMIPFLGIGIIISALIYCIVIYFCAVNDRKGTKAKTRRLSNCITTF